MQPLNIGDAAAAAGVTPKMIRHYESLGLIPGVQRTEAGYRLYAAREVAMLRFIRQARNVGFSIQQIEGLLGLWRDEHRASREVKALAKSQLADLEARRRELDEMVTQLAQLVEHCRGDEDPHCAILDHLATAGSAVPAPAKAARKTLKETRAGTKRPAAHCHDAAPAPAKPATPAHAGLSAWARGLGR
jgi:Cu(I)-responsive transcriptional regulator